MNGLSDVRIESSNQVGNVTRIMLTIFSIMTICASLS